ncbi:MAG: HEPN domain-containing protein [Candidatus Tectomicrobia bacterium]|uniref:HEPN domain-containing protein n=1 Tax=Tectimicrobiota bacterium TaxID=2528274 RepID=A0A932GRF6_UNCTE|nr:HEPN domain-containing protein [Candidatus Tectomicrobia bacterium]
MTRRTKRVRVDHHRSRDHLRVAENFYEGAEVAREFEYWNAAGVLIIHAAIAYADAITIKVAGTKSRGEDHRDLVDLIEETVALDSQGKTAVNHLRRLIDEKNLVSYSGHVYTRADTTRLSKLLERFRSWALSLLKT